MNYTFNPEKNVYMTSTSEGQDLKIHMTSININSNNKFFLDNMDIKKRIIKNI